MMAVISAASYTHKMGNLQGIQESKMWWMIKQIVSPWEQKSRLWCTGDQKEHRSVALKKVKLINHKSRRRKSNTRLFLRRRSLAILTKENKTWRQIRVATLTRAIATSFLITRERPAVPASKMSSATASTQSPLDQPKVTITQTRATHHGAPKTWVTRTCSLPRDHISTTP